LTGSGKGAERSQDRSKSLGGKKEDTQRDEQREAHLSKVGGERPPKHGGTPGGKRISPKTKRGKMS